jgi:predicted nucleic acid-binding protein
LPQATSALHLEVLQMIDREALYGRGIGYVDAHLLAAARLTAGSKLWTRDRRLQRVADQLGLAAAPSH